MDSSEPELVHGVGLSQLQAMLWRSPFHRWLGLRVVAFVDGSVTVELPWREELMSNPDARIVHGGVLATLIDTTADLAIGARLGHTLPTVDLFVDYHKPAVSAAVHAVGRVVRIGSTFCTSEATVVDRDGVMIARGRGVFLSRRLGAAKTDGA